MGSTGDLNLTRVRALLVDDNEFARDFAATALNALNIRDIHRASDSLEGYKAVSSLIPDLVLVDWVMQPISGVELIKQIRSHPNNAIRFIPIIMVTAYSELWRVHNIRDAGANEVVVKPFSAQTLYAKIRAIVDNPRPFIEAPGTFFGPDRRRRRIPVLEDRRNKPARV
jgi:two-component system, chemotaxis family, chemotaxis protein CheY